jgi:PadR family transcriptional regulator PadR
MAFQLGATLLDACVLAVLNKEDTYGYVLTQNVRDVMDISESTLYPVLRRLQKEELLTTYDQPFQGRNRRYYSITELGRKKSGEYLLEWQEYKVKIDKIMLGGAHNGNGNE